MLGKNVKGLLQNEKSEFTIGMGFENHNVSNKLKNLTTVSQHIFDIYYKKLLHVYIHNKYLFFNSFNFFLQEIEKLISKYMHSRNYYRQKSLFRRFFSSLLLFRGSDITWQTVQNENPCLECMKCTQIIILLKCIVFKTSAKQ